VCSCGVRAEAYRTCRPRGTGRLREAANTRASLARPPTARANASPIAPSEAKSHAALIPMSYSPVSSSLSTDTLILDIWRCCWTRTAAVAAILTSVSKATIISTYNASGLSPPNCAELLQPHNSIKIACHSRTLRTPA